MKQRLDNIDAAYSVLKMAASILHGPQRLFDDPNV